MLKKSLVMCLAIFAAMPAWAEINLEPLLNKVTVQLNTEQWVTTKTAIVIVGVNAAVAGQGIEQIQNDVMQKLNQLSNKGEWHILSFDRQQDKTGLENIQIAAQARLPQSELSSLRDQAKALSKPGVTFTLDNVQFIPSEDEVRQAQTALRTNLYQQAKTEIDNLNKMYPDQKYYLHQIDFVAPLMATTEMTGYSMVKLNGVAGAVAPRPAVPLVIGNKVALQAVVVLASMPDQVTQAITK
ncbi:MAG TPA: hypothetical protein VHZ76_02365 [Gammaproteobacteria bacterium]|jgi:hypothetical protein|nr:hypothetical protein [Gammaproteobacteria bacterium]